MTFCKSFTYSVTLLLLTLSFHVPSLLLHWMYETLKEWKLNLNVPAFLKMHVCVEPMKKSLIPPQTDILQLNDKDLTLCLIIYVSR